MLCIVLLACSREFGFPSHRRGDVESVNYIFNGDFVDRGAHQVSVQCTVQGEGIEDRVIELQQNAVLRDHGQWAGGREHQVEAVQCSFQQ